MTILNGGIYPLYCRFACALEARVPQVCDVSKVFVAVAACAKLVPRSAETMVMVMNDASMARDKSSLFHNF